MMKKKRVLALLTVLALLSSILVGCGSNANEKAIKDKCEEMMAGVNKSSEEEWLNSGFKYTYSKPQTYNALVDGAKSLLASDNSSEDGFELNNSILWGFNGMTRAWLVTSLLSDLKNEAPDLYDSYLKDVSSSYIFLFPPMDKSITDYFSYWVVIFAGTECLHFTYTPEAPSCYYDTLKNVSIEDLISIFEDQATQIWEVTADDLNELNAMASGETMK